MSIKETKPVSSVEQVTHDDSRPVIGLQPRRDRISVGESERLHATVDAARGAAGKMHASRLKELEQAVRTGNYHPSPSQVAEEILRDAELEARLRAMLEH